MSPRLYISPPIEAGMERGLEDEDAHYLTRVLRLRPGAKLRCFDGSGSEWQARLARRERGPWQIVTESRVRHEALPRPSLHLAQAWLKGQAMDRVVQKATELGVCTIWPLRARRSNVHTDPTRTANRIRHWQRIARSAAEQSERLYLPTIKPPLELQDILATPPCANILFLDPGAPPIPNDLPREELVLLVGPEGGWTDVERSAAGLPGVRMCGLGNLVLRAETAPVAGLAAVRQVWGWH